VLLEPAFWDESVFVVAETSLLFTLEEGEVVVEVVDWVWDELEEVSPDAGFLFNPARRSLIYWASLSKFAVS
jgi:hypothetical protein